MRYAAPFFGAGLGLLLVVACPNDFDVFEGSPSEAGTTEGGGGRSAADASVDAPPAPVDANEASACPSACSGGCDGGTCIINATGSVTCPPGLACHVRCRADSDCDPALIT